MTRPRQEGFTLIEIMMVVALLGLTVSLSMPAFLHAIKRQGMNKAETDLLTDCQDARRKAILENQPVDLVIHPLDGTFGVPGVNDQAQLPDTVVIDILGVNFIQHEKDPEARVRFYQNGTSDEFTIVLHGADGTYRKLYLDTVTALPQVEDIR